MKGANFSVEERAAQYVEAVRFYLTKGQKVVFAENSGCIEAVSKHFEGEENIEWLDVAGPAYDQSRGKGYNETLLIHKAVQASTFIQEAGCFFKITGRLKLLNVVSMLGECDSFQHERHEKKACGVEKTEQKTLKYWGGLQFLADCKDHRVYEWLHMPINGHVGECRYWFATVQFFEERMWPKLEQMNDFSTPPYLAEDAMLAVCRETRGQAGCRDRFRTQARISGRGGHNLGKGASFFYSTDNDSLALKTKCCIRQVLRWVLPFWRA